MCVRCRHAESVSVWVNGKVLSDDRQPVSPADVDLHDGYVGEGSVQSVSQVLTGAAFTSAVVQLRFEYLHSNPMTYYLPTTVSNVSAVY